jgi:hypothetical protein
MEDVIVEEDALRVLNFREEEEKENTQVGIYKPVTEELAKTIQERQRLVKQGKLPKKSFNYIDSGRFFIEEGLQAKGITNSGSQTVSGFDQGNNRSDFIDLVYKARINENGSYTVDSDFKGEIDLDIS